ncbi:MAG: MarR family winged helix-turn-helix transcriptional regulator [Paracoccaceae bacterium]|nr:MarR family winged helix-turn-helix transcriptional regulator [Paracoccaceae bacterium]
MTEPTHVKDTTGPDIALCAHATLRRAMRVISQSYDAALKPAGLKATQFTVLAVIAGRDPMPMTRLAEILVMDRTTLTRNLKPLVAKGWTEIGRERDERVRLVSATGAGKAVVAEAIPLWRQAQGQVERRLGADRLSALLGGLRALTEDPRG